MRGLNWIGTEGDTGASGLEVRNLSVRYKQNASGVYNVSNLSFSLRPGRIFGLAGESGCGKSTTAIAAIGAGSVTTEVSGSSFYRGTDLLKLSLDQKRELWGKEISYVSQSASLSLHPSIPVGKLIAHPLKRHLNLSGGTLRDRQMQLLGMVELPQDEELLNRFTFQFSGGQLQRLALAVALACEPKVVIMDEPTTGLDVTTQAKISLLLKRIVDTKDVSVLYVSHDLALLSNISDDLGIMYAGQIAEYGQTAEVIGDPRHPYTKWLLGLSSHTDDRYLLPGIPGVPPPHVVRDKCSFAERCLYVREECLADPVELEAHSETHMVRCVRSRDLDRALLPSRPQPQAVGNSDEILLEVDKISVRYPMAPRYSVKDVSFDLRRGQRVGIVGESGSGKSTVLNVIAGLVPFAGGKVRLKGTTLPKRSKDRSRDMSKCLQLVFQNPDTALNPRHSITNILLRPLKLFRPDIPADMRQSALNEIMEQVRLPIEFLNRFPRDLSGGQRQRVAIARAFLADPQVLLCDEVTSALDVSVQATIMELISEMSAERGVAVIFVSHDLGLVRSFASTTVVMKDGMVVEQRDTRELFTAPSQSYTRELILATPSLGQQNRRIDTAMPPSDNVLVVR